MVWLSFSRPPQRSSREPGTLLRAGGSVNIILLHSVRRMMRGQQDHVVLLATLKDTVYHQRNLHRIPYACM